MSLSLLATIIGLLGIGTFFDAVVKPAQKRTVSHWLSRAIEAHGEMRFTGSRLLDRMFGAKIFGWKVLPRYIGISLGSITLSFVFAVATSPPEVQREMTILPVDAGLIDLLMVGLCLLAAVAGDLLSYAQTRLFVRQIDGTRNGVVMVGLAAADLAVSLTIFLAAFSLARLACVAIVLQMNPEIKISHVEEFSPTILREQFATGTAAERLAGSNANLAIAAAQAAPVRDDLNRLAAIGYENVQRNFGAENPLIDAVEVSVHPRCAEGRLDRDARRRAADHSANLAYHAAAEIHPRNMGAADFAQDRARADYARIEAQGMLADGCQFEIYSLVIAVPASEMMARAGPVDAWFASFDLTLLDTAGVAGQKFSPYVSFDPYDDVPHYLSSLAVQIETSLLGIVARPRGASALIKPMIQDEIVEGPEINVPFTPMAASSLTTFVFLVGYLASLGLVAARIQTARALQKILPNIEIEKAVFTTISLALIAIVVGASVLHWALWSVWSALLG